MANVLAKAVNSSVKVRISDFEGSVLNGLEFVIIPFL